MKEIWITRSTLIPSQFYFFDHEPRGFVNADGQIYYEPGHFALCYNLDKLSDIFKLLKGECRRFLLDGKGQALLTRACSTGEQGEHHE